jgi:hypothetical protein
MVLEERHTKVDEFETVGRSELVTTWVERVDLGSGDILDVLDTVELESGACFE